MNNGEKYRKVFNSYYDSATNDKKIIEKIQTKQRSPKRTLRLAVTIASLIFVLSGTTLVVGASTGIFHFADIFRYILDDPTSADIVEAGTIQELDIQNETDEFRLKLVAFTGDIETHIAMFELTPKKDLNDFNEISLVGNAFSPGILESGDPNSYYYNEVKGFELRYDEEKTTYYFSFSMPPHWIKNTNEDVVLSIKGVKFYSDGNIADYITSDMLFQFSPNRSMLKQSRKIEVNQLFTKDVFDDIVGFPADNEDSVGKFQLESKEINAPKTGRSVKVEDITITNYKTILEATIIEDNITSDIAGNTWNQFTEPRYITNHFWDGIEKQDHYNTVLVENEERFRLYVDDVEMMVHEEALLISPGKGRDKEGNYDPEGYYACNIEFDAFDYNSAQKVEIHFGDNIIQIK